MSLFDPAGCSVWWSVGSLHLFLSIGMICSECSDYIETILSKISCTRGSPVTILFVPKSCRMRSSFIVTSFHSHLIYLMLFFIAGGLLCFDIFDEDMVEWQQKLLQMVNSGILECVTKEKVPLYNVEGRQTETNAFVFKVLKN